MKKDRILITGANGFVGRAIVAALLERGHLLNIAVREAIREPWLTENNQLKIFVTGDLSDNRSASRLHPAFSDVGTVIHLAGLAHIAAADRSDAESDSFFFRANFIATRNLVEMSLSHRVSSFIHLSSLAAITNNTSIEKIDDNTAFPPSTGYGRSKALAEIEIGKLADAAIFAISLRPPLIIGAEARGNWAALQRLASTGLPLPFGSFHSKRSFASIQTITDAILTLCNKTPPPSLSGNYCLADTESLSTAEVVTVLREGMNITPRLFSVPTRAFTLVGSLTGRQRQLSGLIGPLEVNPSRFFENFDFHPTMPLKEAVRRSGAEYFAQCRS